MAVIRSCVRPCPPVTRFIRSSRTKPEEVSAAVCLNGAVSSELLPNAWCFWYVAVAEALPVPPERPVVIPSELASQIFCRQCNLRNQPELLRLRQDIKEKARRSGGAWWDSELRLRKSTQRYTLGGPAMLPSCLLSVVPLQFACRSSERQVLSFLVACNPICRPRRPPSAAGVFHVVRSFVPT
jgi:hypothetical protein